jgi:hypothetical protein
MAASFKMILLIFVYIPAAINRDTLRIGYTYFTNFVTNMYRENFTF